MNRCAPSWSSWRERRYALEGYRLLRQLRSLQVETRAVILPESRDRDPAIDTFRCGARGVIARDEPLTTLNKCIRVFDPGQIWVSTQHLDYLLEARANRFHCDCKTLAALKFCRNAKQM